MKFNTQLVHGAKKEAHGATHIPIYQSSAYEYDKAEDLEDLFAGKKFGYIYSRISNPTIADFENRLNALEGGAGCVACSSGMAAISVALLSILKAGDNIVSGGGIFGGTFSLFKNLEYYNISTKYARDTKAESFKEQIDEDTRAIFLETLGNPKLDLYNIAEISKVAKDFNVPLIVDNTLLTPYILKPIAEGADIVIHSTSKNLNGTGTAIGGAVIYSGKFSWDEKKYPMMKEYNKFGPFSYLARVRKELFKDLGVCASPFNSFLTSIGLDTLGLRMEKACDNSLKLAKFLEENKDVLSVNYPGLESYGDYELAKELLKGNYGTLITFRAGSKEKAFKIINSLKFAKNLANIGDTRTLVIHPASTIYAPNTIEERESLGVYEDSIRISVGIEDIEDLIKDFGDAIKES